MMQLLAVTCLSLAAKMEETETPPIVDFQVRFPVLDELIEFCSPLTKCGIEFTV